MSELSKAITITIVGLLMLLLFLFILPQGVFWYVDFACMVLLVIVMTISYRKKQR